MAQMIFSCPKTEWVINFPRYQTLMSRHPHQQIPLSPILRCHPVRQQQTLQHQHQMKPHLAHQPIKTRLHLRDNLQLHLRLMSILILIMFLPQINMKVRFQLFYSNYMLNKVLKIFSDESSKQSGDLLDTVYEQSSPDSVAIKSEASSAPSQPIVTSQPVAVTQPVSISQPQPAGPVSIYEGVHTLSQPIQSNGPIYPTYDQMAAVPQFEHHPSHFQHAQSGTFMTTSPVFYKPLRLWYNLNVFIYYASIETLSFTTILPPYYRLFHRFASFFCG